MGIRDGKRKPNGHFGANNNASPGGDSVSTKRGLDFKDALMNAVTPKQVREMVAGLIEIALKDDDSRNRIAATKEVLDRIVGRSAEAVVGDTHNHFGNILVTSAADALKRVAEKSDEDPMRGFKRLPSPNGKGKRAPRGNSG